MVQKDDRCLVVHISKKRVGVYGVGNEFDEEEYILCGKDKDAFLKNVKEKIKKHKGKEGKSAFISARNELLDNEFYENIKNRTEFPVIRIQSDTFDDQAYVFIESSFDDLEARWDYSRPRRNYY